MNTKPSRYEAASGLKNCPFCAGRASIVPDAGKICFVCGECGARVHFMNIKYPLKMNVDNPVLCWNRRPL